MTTAKQTTRSPRRGDLAILGGARIDHLAWIAKVELDADGDPARYEVMALSNTNLPAGNAITLAAGEVIGIIFNQLEPAKEAAEVTA